MWITRTIREHVELIYKEGYWDRVKADQLPSGVDFCTFDWAVNSGPGRAAKALQKSVIVVQDGAIGPRTLAAVEEKGPMQIIEDITGEREQFYKSLKTFDTFGKGWLRRNDETCEYSLLLAGGMT